MVLQVRDTDITLDDKPQKLSNRLSTLSGLQMLTYEFLNFVTYKDKVVVNSKRQTLHFEYYSWNRVLKFYVV